MQEGAVLWQDVQQRQQGREGVLQRLVQGEDLAGDLGPDGAEVIAIVHMAITLQQVEDREVRRGFAVRHRGALQHPPALRVVRVDHLIHQAGLAHPRLPYQGDHLAMPGLRPRQGLVQRLQLGAAAPQRG